MTREDIVNILNTKNVSKEQAINMFSEKATDEGKTSEEINKAISVMTTNPLFTTTFIQNSLDYFKNKYEINYIIKDNQIICYL